MKAILCIGVFIVLLQSSEWVESDEVAIRKASSMNFCL